MSVLLFQALLPFIMLAIGAVWLVFWYFVLYPRQHEYLVIRYVRDNNGKLIDWYTVYISYKQLKEEGKQQ